MNIPLNVPVYCTDGLVGITSNVVLNPVTGNITHLIVRLKEQPHTEYLTPLKLVGETSPAAVNLHCSLAQLQLEVPFEATDFITLSVPHYQLDAYGWPLVQTEKKIEQFHRHQIPLGELSVHRGAVVMAKDGRVGRIDEFVANEGGHVTHIVMRNGHLWGKKEIVIPLEEVANFETQLVRLKLTKKQVEALPTIKILR